jgi:probable phosphoglycerate mutase
MNPAYARPRLIPGLGSAPFIVHRVASRIFAIRHADVENPRRVLYGHLPGFGLSASGRARAAAVGDRLKSTAITRIVHSPLQRALETGEIVAARLETRPVLEPDGELREAEFSRYLQGVPYWQVPVRRPLWFVHKARRGILPGDESIQDMGQRVLDVIRRMAAERPGEAQACISHADPLQAAWVLLDGRPHNEREMYRKSVDKAGCLEIELDGATITGFQYIPPPPLPKQEPAPASS